MQLNIQENENQFIITDVVCKLQKKLPWAFTVPSLCHGKYCTLLTAVLCSLASVVSDSRSRGQLYARPSRWIFRGRARILEWIQTVGQPMCTAGGFFIAERYSPQYWLNTYFTMGALQSIKLIIISTYQQFVSSPKLITGAD